jgi:hypothetical protein
VLCFRAITPDFNPTATIDALHNTKAAAPCSLARSYSLYSRLGALPAFSSHSICRCMNACVSASSLVRSASSRARRASSASSKLLLRLGIHLQGPVLPVLPALLAGHALGFSRVTQRPFCHIPPPGRVRGNVLHHPFGRIILQPAHVSNSPWPALRRIHILASIILTIRQYWFLRLKEILKVRKETCEDPNGTERLTAQWPQQVVNLLANFPGDTALRRGDILYNISTIRFSRFCGAGAHADSRP